MESIKTLYKIGHGPSSSHTIGPEYTCDYIINKYENNIDAIVVTLYESLAFTGKGHLTDKIIEKKLHNYNLTINFDLKTHVKHPNTLIFDLYKDNKIIDTVNVVSIGGGNIEINNIAVTNDDVYNLNSFESIKDYCNKNSLNLADYVYQVEGNDIKEYLKEVYKTMVDSINRGLLATGELPGGLHVIRKAKQLFEFNDNDNKQTRLVSAYAFAVSEENASGGLIVTAPTCGASGVLPAALYYYEQVEKVSRDRIIDALAVAGLIGNLIRTNAAISGAYAGCQSEIGSACAMAAAAIAYLNNEDIEVIEYASEIAIEHHLGLTCDPIGGLVQIPCIERNAVASLRAISAANIAKYLNGTRKVSLDMVIKTMYETGKDLKKAYKETSIGGLAKHYK